MQKKLIFGGIKDLRKLTATYEDLSLLYSFTKPGAHWRQSVKAGPVHPRQALAHRRQKRLVDTKYSAWEGESSMSVTYVLQLNTQQYILYLNF